MKTISIVGARPQFVKAAVLSKAISNPHILIHTGQHYDANMSDIFFQEMEIPKPDYHLGIGNCSHGAMTGRMMEGLEQVLLKEKPDWVIVYGDTNSTLAGVLAAAKLHIPIAHVEAGLRSFNKKMPEEINRVVADHCANLLFTPSETATKQLLKEGIAPSQIIQSGDVMLDAALHYQQFSREKSQIAKKLGVEPKKFILATLHRSENTDNPVRLKEILHGLNSLAEYMPLICPLHPRTRKAIETHQLNHMTQKLTCIDPVSYLDMIQLESLASAIVTDSGGVQKEAYFFKTPCFILRDETEWVELVEFGFSSLVSLDAIEKQVLGLKEKNLNWDLQLYGDGLASNHIARELMK